MSFLGFVSKIDFLVTKITNFTHKSGYLGKMGSLGPKMSTPEAYKVPLYCFFITTNYVL
jgi:hypothetical protein